MNVAFTAVELGELQSICDQINRRGLSQTEWGLVESDDEFESEHFAGGFDSVEGLFCFSYFDASGGEQWFDLSLSDVEAILGGAAPTVVLRQAT